MGKKILISLAALVAALVALAPPVATGQAETLREPARIQPLSNGAGGGP